MNHDRANKLVVPTLVPRAAHHSVRRHAVLGSRLGLRIQEDI
jgi:hypothetical protein